MIEQTPDREPWRTDIDFKFKLLNLNEIIDDPTIHISVRQLAAQLVSDYNEGIFYRSTGSFFYGLSNYLLADLFTLQSGFDEEYLEWISNPTDKTSYNLRNLTTLALLLARAEGQTEITAEVLQLTLPWLCSLIRYVSKKRKEGKEMNYKEIGIMHYLDEVYSVKKG